MNHRSQIQQTFNIRRNAKQSQSGWPSTRITFFCLHCKIIALKLVKTNLIDVFPHLLELVNWNQKLVSKSQHNHRRKFEFKSFSDPKFHCFSPIELSISTWLTVIDAILFCARQFLSFHFLLVHRKYFGYLSINLIYREMKKFQTEKFEIW